MNDAASSESQVVDEHRFRAMNTDVHVIVVDGDPSLLALAESLIHDYEARWSRFRATSELSCLNAAPGRPVVISPDTYRLIEHAVDAHRLSDGVFDPTVLGSLLDAGYDRSFELLSASDGSSTVPPRPAPTPSGIEFFPMASAVRLPEGTGLDLGGIAKGAAADAVLATVMERGATGCCINIGGDLRVDGPGPDDGAWGIALDCPGAEVTAAVHLGAGAVCTSTVLRRRWGGADHPEHHLRSPDTGRPLSTGLVSATVVAERAAQAEVLTKVLLAGGADEAASTAVRWGVTGLVIDDAGHLLELPGLDRFGFVRQGEVAA
ncbi:MAG: FAD:protein FMN transferase [Actinomycetota bacterium]